MFLLLLSNCGNKEEAPKVKPEVIRPVKAFQVGVQNYGKGRNYPAKTKPSREVKLAFRVSGPLINLNAEETKSVLDAVRQESVQKKRSLTTQEVLNLVQQGKYSHAVR